MPNVAPARTALKRKSVKIQEESVQKEQRDENLKMIFIVEGTGLLTILLQYTEISSMIGKKIEVKTKNDFQGKVNEFDKKIQLWLLFTL